VWSGKERWYTYDGIKLLDEPAGTTGDGEPWWAGDGPF